MQDTLIAYFSRFFPLSKAEKDCIKQDMEIREFSRGSMLQKEGELAMYSYFVLKGCVRQFRLVDGDEKTLNFFIEEDWIISPPEGKEISTYSLSCLEGCFLVLGNEEKGKKIFEQFPRLQEISGKILEKEFLRQQNRMAAFMTASPEKRYLQILEERPDLIERVPLFQLASYIGIKPESLSRIRNRISTRRD
jgi:CRP-like cAMP-binding protein